MFKTIDTLAVVVATPAAAIDKTTSDALTIYHDRAWDDPRTARECTERDGKLEGVEHDTS